MSPPEVSLSRAERLAIARRLPRRKHRLVVSRPGDLATMRSVSNPLDLWQPTQLRKIVAAAKAVLGPAWPEAGGAVSTPLEDSYGPGAGSPSLQVHAGLAERSSNEEPLTMAPGFAGDPGFSPPPVTGSADVRRPVEPATGSPHPEQR